MERGVGVVKHTPGVLGVKAVGLEYDEVNGKLTGTLDIEINAKTVSFSELDDIAKLYFAAPKLLEACEAAYSFITNAEATQKQRQLVAGQLYNALAKAEGKEGF